MWAYPGQCVKLLLVKSTSTALVKVWLWHLFIVIAKQNKTGNWNYLNSKGSVELDAIEGMCGIMISWPACLPCDILASMVFAESLVITHLVPLVNLRGSKDRKIIIGVEIFKENKENVCEGNPETSREFKIT